MCDNQFSSSLKKKVHTHTEVSYLGRDLGNMAAVGSHMSLNVRSFARAPVRTWHCHCLVFCKVAPLRTFRGQRGILASGLTKDRRAAAQEGVRQVKAAVTPILSLTNSPFWTKHVSLLGLTVSIS